MLQTLLLLALIPTAYSAGEALSVDHLKLHIPANVYGILTAELASDAAYDIFLALPPHPDGLKQADEVLTAWGDPPSPWDKLGWKPDGDIAGTYWVEVLIEGGKPVPHVHGAARTITGKWVHFVATNSKDGRFIDEAPIELDGTPLRCAPMRVKWTESLRVSVPSWANQLAVIRPDGKWWLFEVETRGLDFDILPRAPAFTEVSRGVRIAPSADERLFNAAGPYRIMVGENLETELGDTVHAWCDIEIVE